MTKNYVCRTWYVRNHISYDRHLWYTSAKGKKWPKMTKKNCITPYLRNCTSYDWGFWYTFVKWWYLQQFFFHFFKILIFWVFQRSSINAKRKFWGVPHLLEMCVISMFIYTHIQKDDKGNARRKTTIFRCPFLVKNRTLNLK